MRLTDGAALARSGYSPAARPHGEKYALYELVAEAAARRIVDSLLNEVEKAILREAGGMCYNNRPYVI